MRYAIVRKGESRSFPEGDPFLDGAVADGEVVLYLGVAHEPDPAKKAILVELGSECLGAHTGEGYGDEGSNVLGFARYRNGDDPPSQLVELVVQPSSEPAAIEAASAVFQNAGFEVAVCADQAGRIIDRLLCPVYNAALRFLDEGLASAEAMDTTCRLGLGYPDGPVERVLRGGLARHYDVSMALDLRERVARAVVAGASRRATAAKFEVSLSFVIKLMQRWRRRGTLAPDRSGGGRRSRLAAHAERVHALMATEPDRTLAELRARLAADGIEVSPAAISRFLAACGLTRKKDPAPRRAGPPGRRRRPPRLARAAAGLERGAPGVHRPRPTWRAGMAGHGAGNGSWPPCPMVIGRPRPSSPPFARAA